MRTLNRPMFRRGGSAGGITSNLKKPRVGLNTGGPPVTPNTQEILARYMQMPEEPKGCLLYTSPSPRDQLGSRMPSSA